MDPPLFVLTLRGPVLRWHIGGIWISREKYGTGYANEYYVLYKTYQ